MNRVLLSATLVLAMASSPAVGCDKGSGTGLDDVDPEFVVNLHDSGDQMSPVVTAMPNGLFLVVWESGCLHDCQGQDGSEFGVYARRFEPSGAPLGAEFRVNDTVDYNQADPHAVMLPDGRFAVVWANEAEILTDAWDVRLKIYGSEGVELTGEVVVNSETDGTQWRPRVGLSSDGTAQVIWEHDGAGIMARRFDSYGDALGPAALLPQSEGGDVPALASVPDGRAVAVWSGGGWEASGIVALRLADGEAVGDLVQVNEEFPAGYPMPAVAMAPGGEFVVAWSGGGEGFQDSYDIRARAFTEDASPLSPELAVNADTDGMQTAAAVTVSAGGDQFLVTWESALDNGTDKEILAKTYLMDGTVQEEDFLVNSYHAQMQDTPWATSTNVGFLVAWQSSPEIGDGYNVYVKLYPLWP